MYERYELYANNLTDWIVGHTIVDFDKAAGSITLDNGIELELMDVSECCAWYEACFVGDIIPDLLVTRVVSEDRGSTENSELDGFRIVILGEHQKICEIDVTGDPTSGYYCTTAEFVVRKRQ